MKKHHKTQEENDVYKAVGTLRQMRFFAELNSIGATEEMCIDILTEAFRISPEDARPLLYRIGRNRDSDEPIPADLRNYLIEKGKALL